MLSQSKIVIYLSTVLLCTEKGACIIRPFIFPTLFQMKTVLQNTRNYLLQVENMLSPQPSHIQLHKTKRGHYHQYRCYPCISVLSNHFLWFSLLPYFLRLNISFWVLLSTLFFPSCLSNPARTGQFQLSWFRGIRAAIKVWTKDLAFNFVCLHLSTFTKCLWQS